MAATRPRILFVEDDKRLRDLTSQFLTNKGFHVHALEEGNQALERVKQESVDLIILDVMLPGTDGFSLCKTLREFFNGPLLFLTAKTELNDELLGFEVGADDYITKPVEPTVLLARVQALLRRIPEVKAPSSDTLQFGQLHIDKQARQISLNNSNIELTSHEFDLLVMLAESAGDVVERDRFYTELIGREYDGLDRSADVRISRLRKKLGDNPQHPYRIKTIWGKGFFFVSSAWD